MSRPALSASRALDILELLTVFPEREFTLSEVSRATAINSASCHAILSVLADRGYLTRSEATKSYLLGPSTFAAGQAASKSQPIIARSKRVAVRLVRDLDLPVMLCTVVGDEILAVVSVENSSGRNAGMFVGERIPMIAPIGLPFMAWADDATVSAWARRLTTEGGKSMEQDLLHDIELTRKRGFRIIMRPRQSASIGAVMLDLSARGGKADFKSEVRQFVNSIEHYARQPEEIEEGETYDVVGIGAPIFDHNGRAAFSLSIGGFSRPLTGEELLNYADQVVQSCVDISRADRTRLRFRA